MIVIVWRGKAQLTSCVDMRSCANANLSFLPSDIEVVHRLSFNTNTFLYEQEICYNC